MATTTKMGEYTATRSNLFSIEPKALFVDWAKNLSRNGQEPPVNDGLLELARDMLPRKGSGEEADGSSGQINPITVRQNSDGRYEVILGYRRMRAALWLVESGECPDFKIKYIVSRMNDSEAALVNMSENLQREDPEPIQTAHAIRRLTEDYGMDIATVAGRLKKSEGWCYNLLKLVSLPKVLQDEVADSNLAVSAAIELAKLPSEAEQISTYNQLAENDQKVTAARVKEKNSSDKTAKGPLGKLKKFLEEKSHENEGGGTLAEMILQFIEGDEGVNESNLSDFWDATFEMVTNALIEEKFN